ncbi:hypothetical protein AB0C10_10475 [Microbispora amethystogenes]|uniref:hypothetical protein n=1 Tax=Microbispora amethystogenes TaxID=1427754 RepID=UPI0033ED303E
MFESAIRPLTAGCGVLKQPGTAAGFGETLPWIGLILAAGVLAGVGIIVLSRKAGDNRWEAIRFGIMGSMAVVGPLLSLMVFYFTFTFLTAQAREAIAISSPGTCDSLVIASGVRPGWRQTGD